MRTPGHQSVNSTAVNRPDHQNKDRDYTHKDREEAQKDTVKMNAIYNHATKQINGIRKDLIAFEKDVTSSPLSLQGSVAAHLTQLSKTIDEYESFAKQESDEVKKEKAEGRIKQFRSDIIDARKKFQELKAKRDELTQEANKSELMRRNTKHVSDNPYDSNASTSQGTNTNYADGLYKEKQSLARGNAILDDILEQAHASFDQLVESNQMLDRARQQLTGVLGTLGVSQETIRTISRAARTDKFIFYGGSLCLFMLLIWIYRWMR